MKEAEKKYSTISVEEVANQMDTSIIKNYIVSDNDRKYLDLDITFKDPCAVAGVAFFICVEGHGRIKINLREYTLEKNTIVTILPGSIIEAVEVGEDLLMEFLFFSFDFISELKLPVRTDIPTKIENFPCLKISEEKAKTLLEFHSFIVTQYKKQNHPYREEMAKILLASLMLEVASNYLEAKEVEFTFSNRKEEVVNQYVKLVIKHYREERTISFYAEKMFLTPKYLAQVIKEATGKPALDWINEITVLAIKSMLKSSSLTVLQISEELNFPNPSFFGRFFKKHTGLTPVQYRES